MAPRILSCLFLVLAADFLLYADQIGWPLGYFGLMVLAFAIVHNIALVGNGTGRLLAAICATLCLALIESVNPLAFALFCAAFAALLGGVSVTDTPFTWLRKLVKTGLNVIGLTLFDDARSFNRYHKRTATLGVLPGLLQGWLLPLAFSAVFVLLFASANPVIEKWLRSFDFGSIDRLLTPERMIFWGVIGVLSWGTLRSAKIRVAPPAPAEAAMASPVTAFLFSRRAVTRSLALFNLMFLAQNLLDAGYLWGGAALPEGLTYAEYAHRGAYPLILTALLAAAFVLIALRRGSELNDDRLIRGLIYLWLLQNMVLVISSIWRTNIYVAEYSLTYLRLAALIWMGLVLAGLIFIVVRIVLDKSSHWLIGVNLAAAFAVMWASCFVDLGRFIADYNVDHSQEMLGSGYRLDTAYLLGIGPSALPALNRLESVLTTKEAPEPIIGKVRYAATLLNVQLQRSNSSWRSWTFRNYRLARELGQRTSI
jgi:hypothetical protein